MITLNINGRSHQVDVDPDTPLLWALRDELHLTGTKFGCGRALCGACTVHIDGEAARSCSIMVGEAAGKTVTTIEGLSGDIARAVQDAWVRAAVPQCGYCQPGFVMAATSILGKTRNQTQEAVLSQITNICRCGTYDAIRTAVGFALDDLKPAGGEPLKQGSSRDNRSEAVSWRKDRAAHVSDRRKRRRWWTSGRRRIGDRAAEQHRRIQTSCR